MNVATDVWVGALIRRAEIAGAFATVVRKGDPRGGAVLVKTYDPRSGAAALFASAFRGEGERVWMQPLSSNEEAELDDYIDRQRRFDPDLWVVEIEDAEGWRFLTEAVEKR